MLQFVQQSLRAALDIVLPFRCAACGDIVAGEPGFCPACWKQLRFITSPHCFQCCEPFDLPVPPSTRCGVCLAQPPSWSMARAVWRYDSAARAPILRLKYGDRTDLVDLFAQHLTRKLEGIATDNCLLIPVPLHRWRIFKRTFNQSALLVQAIHKKSGMPASFTALIRTRNTRPQQGLTRAERLKNVHTAFRVPDTERARLTGRTVILVDDVVTTGATVEACARLLLRAGAADVRLLTLARVVNVPKNLI
jgi:ComF family protein